MSKNVISYLYFIIQFAQHMLSKQEKLKYGQMLRQQMKEKEEKKKIEEMDKRGIRKNNNQLKMYPQKQNNTLSHEKQSLQRRFQNVDYGPFGRPGAGAPNRQNEQNHYQPHSAHSHQLQNQNRQGEYEHWNRIKTQEQENGYEKNNLQTEGYSPNFQKPPIRQNIQDYNPNLIQQRQFQEQYPPKQFQNNQYIPPNNDHFSQNPQYYQNIPSNQPLIPTYGNAYQLHQASDRSKVDYYPPQSHQNRAQYPPQNFQGTQDYNKQNGGYQKPYEQINRKHEQNRQKTLQNQEMMDIHKKGGRNLLQLQNMTAQQHLIKQKQKLEMQRQLKLQMEQVQRRKKQQKQRRQRQEREQQIKNQQYHERQKQKILEQERSKNEKQKEIIEQNVRNLEERKRLEEEAKMKANQLKNKSFQKKSQPVVQQKETFSRQAQFQISDQTQSQGSSSTVMEKAFNTDVSRQFFQKERRRDQERFNREKNLEVVTDQIKKMRDQIDRQNEMFKKEIDKVKYESEIAEHQKRKAQQEIQNLKDQLKKKMEDDNERLFMALQRQQKLKNESEVYQLPQNKQNKKREQYYDDEQELRQIPRAKKNESLVNKKYVVPKQVNDTQKYNPNLEQSNISEDGLQSLHGESKKIPLNIDDPKLSMSRLSDYARQTQFFKNPPQNRKKNSYQIQQSIVEQEEERMQSRGVKRKNIEKLRNQKDELDKMMQSRQKSRGGWGEMSSVNSDITKQIEQLLKKKEGKNERPTSHLSNAGRQTLSRHGLQYEGQSLATINTGGNGTINTLDYDRIHNRNEARLNQLRNLGVETINTNNDEQFSKLDEILNKYKQDRSRVH